MPPQWHPSVAPRNAAEARRSLYRCCVCGDPPGHAQVRSGCVSAWCANCVPWGEHQHTTAAECEALLHDEGHEDNAWRWPILPRRPLRADGLAPAVALATDLPLHEGVEAVGYGNGAGVYHDHGGAPVIDGARVTAIARLGRRGAREPRECWERLATHDRIPHDWVGDPRRRFSTIGVLVWLRVGGNPADPADRVPVCRAQRRRAGTPQRASRVTVRGPGGDLPRVDTRDLRIGDRYGATDDGSEWELVRDERYGDPQEAPTSVALAVALASDPAGVLAAEAAMREHARRHRVVVGDAPPADVVCWSLVPQAALDDEIRGGPGIPNDREPCRVARLGYRWHGTGDGVIRLVAPELVPAQLLRRPLRRKG